MRASICFVIGAAAAVLTAGLGASAQTPESRFSSTSSRLQNILEGNWQSCQEMATGRYGERVYDHVVNGVGQFEVHLGPGREFAIFPGVQDSMTRLAQVRHELAQVIVGQDRVVDRLLVAVLAGGHVLLEGAPGLGKTLLLATLARTLGGTFNRIQFTPDLIPSDIVGTRIFRASSEAFDVEPGPIIANVVLVRRDQPGPPRASSRHCSRRWPNVR